jgi:hypothetical protein
MFPGQLLTVKWSNRIAQGFSPGFWCAKQACPESIFNPPRRMQFGEGARPRARENVPEPNGVFSSAVIKRARLR